MAKGTSQAEVKLNSEKFKPIALAIVKLHLSEGISQLQGHREPPCKIRTLKFATGV